MDMVLKDMKRYNISKDLAKIDWTGEIEFIFLTPTQLGQGFDDDDV